MEKRYNAYSDHLKQKFGAKVYKITLDAGFSCPNRDGTISNSGCIFCDDSGSFSQAHSNRLSIEEQVQVGIETLRNRFKAQKFMSYFQAFSNTYKPVKELDRIYKASLTHPDIVGLSIGTRPDCIDMEKLSLINSIANDYYTWIEYGLQTVHDKTLQKINRGHDYNCFLKTYEDTRKFSNINICLHVILNLFENYDEMMETAKNIAKLEPDGVKIHMLCALEGTKLAQLYQNGEIDFMSQDEYVSTVCDFLEYLPLNTTIHRLAGNGLKSELIAPRWIGKKLDTMNKIDKELFKRNSMQGSKFIVQ
ncbi:TIGR01212 family radical SAM protein [bacterium]|nr:TIGR01212 family radical SAM protein [bacterium]